MRGAVANGKVIRELRRSLGLTQEKLAAKSACDVKTVRHAENSRRLDIRTLSRIAEALETVLSSIVRHAKGTLDHVQRNIQHVHRWRRAFYARDVDGLLAVYHDEAVLIYPEGSPNGGVFRGKAAIRRQAEITFECFDTEPITPKMMRSHAVDNVVCARGKTTCTVRATGVTFTSQVVHEFQFENGLVVQHTGLFDTLSMAKGLNPKAFDK